MTRPVAGWAAAARGWARAAAAKARKARRCMAVPGSVLVFPGEDPPAPSPVPLHPHLGGGLGQAKREPGDQGERSQREQERIQLGALGPLAQPGHLRAAVLVGAQDLADARL